MNGFRIWRNSTARRRSFLRLICSAQLPLIRNCISKANTPSLDLHLKVRSAFVSKGTSLRGWCMENGVPPQNARDVLIGRWNGPKGQALRRRLLKAAGLGVSV